MLVRRSAAFLFFFNDTATTEIYTLSLHDALPISADRRGTDNLPAVHRGPDVPAPRAHGVGEGGTSRSEEHTSELQSRSDLVCRLLLEKKKTPCKSRTWSGRTPRTRSRRPGDPPAA